MAVTRLPHLLRQDFFKGTRDIGLTDGTLNLIGFEKWLEKKSKVLFNPLAEPIANWDKKYKNIKGPSINVLHRDGFSSTNHQLPPNESSANES